MKCDVCGVPQGERELFSGISIGEIISICEPCAEEKGIPLIKKPSAQQLDKADEHHSVRERMERLSGMRRTTPISDESTGSQALRARLKNPPQVQSNDVVVPNYHWNLTLARRRRKLTIGQVSRITGVDQGTLSAIERGKIPQDFEEVFSKLEDHFKIELLKERPKKIMFKRRDPEYEKEILASVKERMQGGDSEEQEDVPDSEEPSTITLNKLIEKKRARDKKQRAHQEKKKEDAMMGDDIELDLDEV